MYDKTTSYLNIKVNHLDDDILWVFYSTHHVNSGIILIRPIIEISLLKIYEQIPSHISIKEKHWDNNVMACHNDYCILQVEKVTF